MSGLLLAVVSLGVSAGLVERKGGFAFAFEVVVSIALDVGGGETRMFSVSTKVPNGN